MNLLKLNGFPQLLLNYYIISAAHRTTSPLRFIHFTNVQCTGKKKRVQIKHKNAFTNNLEESNNQNLSILGPPRVQRYFPQQQRLCAIKSLTQLVALRRKILGFQPPTTTGFFGFLTGCSTEEGQKKKLA